jgi:hypothetical protein
MLFALCQHTSIMGGESQAILGAKTTKKGYIKP